MSIFNATSVETSSANKRKKPKWVQRDYVLFAIACMGAVFLAIFAYVPMVGILIAFKDDSMYFNILKNFFLIKSFGQ